MSQSIEQERHLLVDHVVPVDEAQGRAPARAQAVDLFQQLRVSGILADSATEQEYGLAYLSVRAVAPRQVENQLWVIGAESERPLAEPATLYRVSPDRGGEQPVVRQVERIVAPSLDESHEYDSSLGEPAIPTHGDTALKEPIAFLEVHGATSAF